MVIDEKVFEEKIDRIEKGVAQNTQAIETLATAVGQNTKDISSLTAAVTGLAATVAQNSKDIKQNSKDIKQNSKDITDLTGIVVAIKTEVEDMKEHMVTKLATKVDLAELREQVIGKAEGVQRGLDAQFERHSGLESRVSKIEVELHPEVV